METQLICTICGYTGEANKKAREMVAKEVNHIKAVDFIENNLLNE